MRFCGDSGAWITEEISETRRRQCAPSAHDCAVTSAVHSGVSEHRGIPTGLKPQPLRSNWTGLNWQPSGSIPVSATTNLRNPKYLQAFFWKSAHKWARARRQSHWTCPFAAVSPTGGRLRFWYSSHFRAASFVRRFGRQPYCYRQDYQRVLCLGGSKPSALDHPLRQRRRYRFRQCHSIRREESWRLPPRHSLNRGHSDPDHSMRCSHWRACRVRGKSSRDLAPCEVVEGR
jgi:hypothetical protein